MELDISPRHSPGSSLHLLSPSHSHASAADGFHAIRQIRQHLSRSPSKASRYTFYSHPGALGCAGNTPTPRSPSHLSRSYGADLSKFDGRSSTNAHRQAFARTRPRRGSPNSPLRRALSDNANQANATSRPQLIRRTSTEHDQENMDCSDDVTKSPTERKSEDKHDTLKPGPERLFQPIKREHAASMKSSPLKRSDGVMNLDTAALGSPRSTKRRSLHSPFATDFNIFETGADGAHSDNAESAEDKEKETSVTSNVVQAPSSPHRRSIGLRRSTLQQRTAPGRRAPIFDSGRDVVMSPAASRPRARFSLDGTLPLRGAENSSCRRSLGNAPPGLFAPQPQYSFQATPKPHPLSKALTPSSSTSSVMDSDSPINQSRMASREVTTTMAAPPIPAPSFSKSLPIGAMRPPQPGPSSSQDSFETPAAFKMAKPLPQAFMSTGLISKQNRNMDIPATAFGTSLNMPDTPSKKAAPLHLTDSPSTSGLLKASRPAHEYSPSTPFNGRRTIGSTETFGKGLSIFGAKMDAVQHVRSGSFVSTDGDECHPSPSKHFGSFSNDDLPPTPTKSTSSIGGLPIKGKSSSLRSSLFGRRTSMGPDTFSAPGRELSPPPAGEDQDDECKSQFHLHGPAAGLVSDNHLPERDDIDAHGSTMPCITFTNCATTPTSRFRSDSLLEQTEMHSPSPLSRRTQRSLPMFDTCSKDTHTKFSPHAAASTSPAPIVRLNRADTQSPHTPQESFTPPDASKLSISQENYPRSFSALFNSHSFPPATPTGPRQEAFKVSVGPGGASMAASQLQASSGYFAQDVDTALTSRFSSVVPIGAGEFSQVYRVEGVMPNHVAEFPLSSSSSTLSSPGGNVWAVKKSRKPYTGTRDRQQKKREVLSLRSLRGHDHVITYFADWECRNHLYIQTEFCENGNLKDFLLQTGFTGRLDDFRVWKILLEVSDGLSAIHSAGFLHLDLKPANIFITFDGCLKIGDFGLATSLPIEPGADVEGDREYIAPEVLQGMVGEGADLFALGMIMVEIAGNCVLPDNGGSWQRLRKGDLSDLPGLTIPYMAHVDAIAPLDSGVVVASADEDDDLAFLRPNKPQSVAATPLASDSSSSSLSHREGDLMHPPQFMVDSHHTSSLDNLVQWIISPDPSRRPSITEVRRSEGVTWVENRRRAGATVFEGTWGPGDGVLTDHGAVRGGATNEAEMDEMRDIEMMDI